MRRRKGKLRAVGFDELQTFPNNQATSWEIKNLQGAGAYSIALAFLRVVLD
jgi:hypothetical protein